MSVLYVCVCVSGLRGRRRRSRRDRFVSGGEPVLLGPRPPSPLCVPTGRWGSACLGF